MFLIHVFYDDRCSYYPAPNMRSGVEKICQSPRRHVRIVSRSYMSGCYPWRPVPGCPWHIHSLDGKSHSTPSCVTPGSVRFLSTQTFQTALGPSKPKERIVGRGSGRVWAGRLFACREAPDPRWACRHMSHVTRSHVDVGTSP